MSIPSNTRCVVISKRSKLWLLLGLSTLWLSGCFTTRSTMYLGRTKVDVYLANEGRPSSTKNENASVEAALKRARDVLRQVPTANRILGGYCNDSIVRKQLDKIQEMSANCYKQLSKFQNSSNNNNIVSWSLIGGTVATGLGMIIGGLAATENNTKAGLAVGFGIPMVAFALTHGLIPFERWHRINYKKGMRLDNYMWTLRTRVSERVCNARNVGLARVRILSYRQRLKGLCADIKADDGIYREK